MKPSLIFLSAISSKKQKTIRETYIIKSPTFIKENDNSFLMLWNLLSLGVLLFS